MRLTWVSMLCGAIATAPLAAAGAECRATSSPQTVAVVELYTSEGCDSCPPADRWLSAIEAAPQSVIPLAFHVDYWDRLGWKDRFADAGGTERQYEQKRRHGGEYVYTPQVLLQGRDFRLWGVRGEPAASVAPINSRPAHAAIDLAAERVGDAALVNVSVDVRDPRERARTHVAVALVQDGLSSEVTAGENRGRRLVHDHVVRQWHAVRADDATGPIRAQHAFALPGEKGPMSIVAIVEDAQTGDVLQAVALPLCIAK